MDFTKLIITNNILNTFSKNNNKSYDNILEPITTIIKLALLSFLPVGTKISIKNNNIYIQNPSYLQGIFRWSNGDKFADLHNLVHPLKKFMEMKDTSHLFDNTKLELFTELGYLGLKKLGETYSNNNITLQALELYQDIIRGIKSRRISSESDDCQDSDRLSSSSGSFDIYEKIITIWKRDEIDIVHNILLHLKNHYKDNNINTIQSDPYLNSIITILENKENDTINILKNIHKRD